MSALRELDRIADQVQQDLAQAQAVQHHRRQRLRTLDTILQAAFRRFAAEHRVKLARHGGQFGRLRRDFHLVRIDFAEVENVVDELEQRVSGEVDRPQVVVKLLRRDRVVAQELAEADDRIERRPELVAHGGEKQAFGFVGVLRLRQRAGELALRFVEIGHVDQGFQHIGEFAVDQDRV